MENYNEESIYDEKISPLMQEIIEICKEHQIPMLASFAFENDPERGVGCCTTHLGFDDRHHENFEKACKVIRSNDVSTMVVTVTKDD